MAEQTDTDTEEALAPLECHICLQPIVGHRYHSLRCCQRHTAYHLSCLRSWLRIQNRCPHCRRRSTIVTRRRQVRTEPLSGAAWFGLALAAWLLWW